MSHSSGLSFKKLDLHVHTPASSCFRDKKVTAEQIVEAALSSELSGIAITDHNSGAWIDDVKKAAAKTALVVFPGVEITCQGGKGGLHIVAILDPSAGQAEIEGLLGELKLEPKSFGQQEALVNKSSDDLFKVIDSRGGVAILAHANSTHGAMADMTGRQRIDLINNPYLSAAEAVDFLDSKKKEKKRRVVDLLSGSDPDFRKMAVYQASDNPLSDGSGAHGLEGIGTRCAHFKMDRIDIEGLRQCLHDPDVRIRQDFEYKSTTYPYISRIAITSGFLDGQDALFHEGLNSILGGKGTGKSLLVEFLRFGLYQQPDIKEIREDHDSKLRDRLREFGTVEISFVDETGQTFSVTREYRETEVSSGENQSHQNISRLFPVLFLSQSEIIRIAERPDSQITFIDKFFDFRSYTTQIRQHEHDLGILDKKYADCLRARKDVQILKKSLGSDKIEIDRLDKALKNPVFEKLQALEQKEKAFSSQLGRTKEIIDSLKETRESIQSIALIRIPDNLSNDASLLRVKKMADDAQQLSLAQLDKSIKELETVQQGITKEHQSWQPEFVTARSEYDGVIKKEGGDYQKLAAQREKVMTRMTGHEKRLSGKQALALQLASVAKERNETLVNLKNTYTEYSNERRTKCKMFENESAGRLKIVLHEASDSDAFRSRLLSLKRGSYMRETEVESISNAVDSSLFIKSVLKYSDNGKMDELSVISELSGLDAEKTKTLVDHLLETLEIEALLGLQYEAMPGDRPEIKFDVGENTYELIDKLSIGQKCTAMLIMALSDGTMPVVIDQPEDSLDIRSVWEDMCMKIRSGKEQRQFIFTTHNSSLAVASDSDKFIILEGSASKGRVVFSGSMDHAPVSDEVLKYLEGGKDTYKMKYLKYDAKRRIHGAQ